MIHKTKVNIDTHINTVDNLKSSLVRITEKSKDTLTNKKQEIDDITRKGGLYKNKRNV